MSVVRLTPDDAGALQALRREALLLHPTAFSADPDIEAQFTLDQWRERLRTRVWFGGKLDGVLCGMAAFSTEPSRKLVIPDISARCMCARRHAAREWRIS